VDFLRRHLLAVPVHQGLREHHMMHIAGLLNRFARGLDLPD
jgi:hypothetical protein